MSDCLFCKIVSGELPAHLVWEDENHLAFLDINPIKPGHVLVIPRLHVPYVFDMDSDAYRGLFDCARNLEAPLRQVTQAERIGIMVEGFKVPHVHMHLVPLYDHTDLNPYNARPAKAPELEAMAMRLREAIA